MKKIEIYLDKNNVLSVAEFRNINADYEKVINGKVKIYEYIKKLASSKIIDIYENKHTESLELEYKNCIISLNEYETLLNKRGMAPLTRSLKKYYESQKLSGLKKKKVQEKISIQEKR